MPRDAVSRTANVERTGQHKWVNYAGFKTIKISDVTLIPIKFLISSALEMTLMVLHR